MILCKITDQKDFMGKLLTTPCFYSFMLSQATVTNQFTYSVNGHRNSSFDTQPETDLPPEYAKWEEISPYLFSLMKGKRLPLSFQITLLLMPQYCDKILNELSLSVSDQTVSHFILNIKFEDGGIFITSAVSYQIFTMDKQFEQKWDHVVRQFLASKQIAFQET